MKVRIKETWQDIKLVWTPVYGEWMTEEDRKWERRDCRRWKATVIVLGATVVLQIATIIIKLLKLAG